jgi:hypothetical protein
VSAKILDINPTDYHARSEFSATMAKELIAKSPLHAKANVGRDPSKNLDRGTVVHRLLLGKGAEYVLVEANDWRTNAAKAARDEARERGLVPVLAHEIESYKETAEAIRGQLAARDIILDGASEVAITWTEQSPSGPVACRGMLDHLWLADGRILDLKVTADAAPGSVERTAENLGYAIQCAAYTRAVAALDPDLAGRVKFLFAFCEPDEPHAVNICQPDGVFRELGERRWLRAVHAWGECLATGKYPGYGDGINYLNPPAWALAREGYSFDER